MAGGRGLLWILLFGFSVLLISAVLGQENSSVAPAPPKAKVEIVEDKIGGHSISDPYRWLEDADSSATQEFDRQELAYARSVLDPCRGGIGFISSLLNCFLLGLLGRRRSAGDITFMFGATGCRTSRCLWCAKGFTEKIGLSSM